MAISKEIVEAAYQRHAKKYDRVVKLYRLIGLHIEKHRARAVEQLWLKPGDRVLDLGCGTGLSFPLLMEKIGPEGELFGVDISSEMLACAKHRVDLAGWKNVTLVESDIAEHEFPKTLNGVFSTGVFGYLNQREEIIEKISQSLVPGGRLVIVDGKRPEKWPKWLFKLFVRISSPYGLTEEYFDARTWEVVERVFENYTFEEVYGGMLYIVSGTPSSPDTDSGAEQST